MINVTNIDLLISAIRKSETFNMGWWEDAMNVSNAKCSNLTSKFSNELSDWASERATSAEATVALATAVVDMSAQLSAYIYVATGNPAHTVTEYLDMVTKAMRAKTEAYIRGPHKEPDAAG